MKRSKFIFSILLTLISCNSLIYASELPTNINNTQVIPVATYEDNTFFPVRILNDLLGHKLSWDPATKSTVLQSADLTVALSVNNTEILVNQVPVTLSKAPKLIDNVLYAPAEFWSKVFNLHVSLQDNEFILTPIEEPTIPPNKTEIPKPEETEKPVQQTILPLFEGSNTYYTGQQLIIRLDENPSTGYVWQVTFPEGLQVISDHFVPNKPEVADSPGEHSWVIKATKDGTYTMEFKKLRPSTPDSVIDTKTFKLKAKPTTALQN